MKKQRFFLNAIIWICVFMMGAVCMTACDMHVHNYTKEVTKEATCGENGLATYTCSCNETYTEEIPATGEHVWDEGVVTSEPRCGVMGEKTFTCTVCETGTYTENIEALMHDIEVHNAAEPTCAGNGWNAYATCKREGCDYTTYTEIPATDKHVWDNAQYCEICGVHTSGAYLEYALNADGESYTVTGIGDCEEKAILLGMYRGKPVTAIDGNAFADCPNITSISLGEYMQMLDIDSFIGCNGLTLVTAEGNPHFEMIDGVLYHKTDDVVTSLVFATPKAQYEIIIPKTIHTIHANAFYGNTAVGVIFFEDNETTPNLRIGAFAFAAMKAAEKVTLPTNLTMIPTGLFENSSVKEVFVPNTVNTIQLRAFYKAASLATLTFEEGNEDNTLVLEDAGWHVTNGASIDGILYGAPLKESGLVLPERVKRIPDYYFGSSSFASVVIPASIEYIGNGAFLSSSAIKSITFAGDATTRAGFVLGFNAFSGCSGVTDLIVPASITKYEGAYGNPTSTATSSATGSYYMHGAFRGMTGLNTLTFEEGLTSLSVGMFYGSGKSMTEIVLPDSLVTIGDAAFNTSKFKSVTFGKNLTTIGNHAFSNATSLATVDFSKNEQLTSIGAYAFEKCKFASLTLPDNSANGVTELTLGRLAFSGNTALTAATIPATVKNLNSAFAGCTKVLVTHVGNETSTDANGFMLTADGKRLAGYSGTATEITIPDGVEIIGDNAFAGKTAITKVTIPASVKVIEGYAFQGCTRLATVEGGDGLMNIGAYAFSGTIIKSFDLTDIVSVGEYAFYNCKQLATVVLDNTMTTIANGVFKNCTALAQIDLPVNLTSLGFETFNGAGLTSIVLPEKLKHSDISMSSGYWFYGCSKLASVTINSTELGVLPYYAFGNCTSLTSIDIPEGVHSIIGSFNYASKLKDITFPSTLKALYGADAMGRVFFYTAIETLDFSNTQLETFGNVYTTPVEKNVFWGMSSLKTVILPRTVTMLPDEVFDGCSALETVIAPGVTEIESYSYGSPFKDKSNLTTVVLSPELSHIKKYTFYGCTSLTNFTFPDSLTTIGNYAFYNTKLAHVEFGNQLETIGDYAFYNTCVTIVSLPASLTEIGVMAFGGCQNFTRFEVDSSNTALYMGDYGELYDAENTLICFPLSAEVKGGVVTLADGVTLGAYAFADTTNLTAVVLPSDLEEISVGAFMNSSITRITIPDGVTKILDSAFYGCTELAEIVIPAYVYKIGTDAFYGCSSLTRFSVDSKNWKFHVGDYGELYDSENTLLYFPMLAAVEGGVVTLGTGVKVLDYAFAGVVSVTEVVLPSDLTALPAYAFENSCITKITIPANVTSIDEKAFRNSIFETVIFADRTDGWTIPANLFQDVTTLKTVTMGSGIASIGNYAFDGCSSLSSLTLSSSLTTIGTHVFRECTSLTTLTLPNSVTSIGDYSFDKCTALTSITLSSSLKTIGRYAFRNAKKVSSIYIPWSVTTINAYAFNGWTASQTIYLVGRTSTPSSTYFKTGWKGSATVKYA